MTREERAKQFLPFDALKGLQEELRQQEFLATRVPRRQLSDEAAALLSHRLSRVKRGDRILVEFYHEGHYLLLEADVTDKNETARTLTLGHTAIAYEDIIRLKIL